MKVKQNTVEVVPYDLRWPQLFQDEAYRLHQALKPYLVEMYHIGSTSIPDMPAKPVIDIMLVCNNLDDLDGITEQLRQLHYEAFRRQIIPHVSFFTKRTAEWLCFNLHVHERGSPQIRRHVNFRDYVVHHPDMALDYAKLKMKLAAQFANDMYSYVSGKDKLVQEIDVKAKLWMGRKIDFLPQHTGPLAKDWSYNKLVRAIQANLNVHMTYFAQYINSVELLSVPDLTRVNSGLKDDTFNYILDTDFTSDNCSVKISEVIDYFKKNNTPFSWWVSPHDKPEDLSTHLENKGFVNTENNRVMYFDLDAWNGELASPPELQIVRATDESTLHDFALVLVKDKASFKTYFSWVASVLTDEDPIEYYVGYVDGKPVVRGLSCYFAQVAGLHWLSTDIAERKKGYGIAMQTFRLKRAKDLGYHIAVLQACEDDYPLYRKLGYKECGNFREYKLEK